MQFVYPEYELTRTQDLEKMYFDAGQFYWGRTSAWCAGLRMHSNGHGYVVEGHRVVDIDTPDDWKRAELIAPRPLINAAPNRRRGPSHRSTAA